MQGQTSYSGALGGSNDPLYSAKQVRNKQQITATLRAQRQVRKSHSGAGGSGGPNRFVGPVSLVLVTALRPRAPGGGRKSQRGGEETRAAPRWREPPRRGSLIADRGESGVSREDADAARGWEPPRAGLPEAPPPRVSAHVAAGLAALPLFAGSRSGPGARRRRRAAGGGRRAAGGGGPASRASGGFPGRRTNTGDEASRLQSD